MKMKSRRPIEANGGFRRIPGRAKIAIISAWVYYSIFCENAKIGIARGSADLEFLQGKGSIRAPGRRTRNGTFLTSSTYSNVSWNFRSAQK